jgi:hypothetical protein
MKLSLTQAVAVASFAMLAAAGAKAESYDGVHQAVSAKTRARSTRKPCAPPRHRTRT